LAGERLYQGRAPTLWAMACLGPEHHANAGWAGDPQACLALGQERAPQRPSQAVRLLQRACEGFPGTPGGQGIHEGCVLLVEVNQRLESQGAPPEQSRQRYGLACGQGVARACAEAGRLWRDEGRGDSGDAQAVRLFQEGCDRGDWSACRQLAWMMERGRGVSLNLPGAADLYERACEAGEAAACFGLGKMLRDGRGVEADPREASALMARACQLGWKPACATP
jgi:TPR repeat protein